ncbi:hypothetical protein, partial [Roseibium polysiphoniae]|uniref:hypothetical protein n=1 Tax=Roseibium polysiphoniae TaxID=2571221 RepID=UPI001AD8CE49
CPVADFDMTGPHQGGQILTTQPNQQKTPDRKSDGGFLALGRGEENGRGAGQSKAAWLEPKTKKRKPFHGANALDDW